MESIQNNNSETSLENPQLIQTKTMILKTGFEIWKVIQLSDHIIWVMGLGKYETWDI